MQRRDAEEAQRLRRDAQSLDALGAGGEPEVRAPHLGRAHRLERVGLGAPVEEVGRRDGEAAAVQHHRRAVGIGIAERLQQDGPHRAEHRGVGADAQAEDQHRGGAEAGRAPQAADAGPQVVPPRLEPAGAAAVAVRFLYRLDAAEALAGGPPRVLGRQAGGDEIAFRRARGARRFRRRARRPACRRGRGRAVGGRCGGGGHALASRKRATSAVARSQLATATRSCSAPVAVSA